MSTPAGWYPDPQNISLHRWWDGRQWTNYTNPPTSPAPTGGSLYNGAKDAAAGKNSAAVWSLVMGFGAFIMAGFAWGFLFGVAAVVWGGIGLSRASRSNKGRALSAVGLALGALSIVASLAWWYVL